MDRIVRNGILFLLVIVATCSCNRASKNHARDDISLIIRRFETELFSVDPAQLESNIPLWQESYGRLFTHFNYVMGFGDPGDVEYPDNLRSFITDPFNYRIYKRTMEVFPALEGMTGELNGAFGIYRDYFPEMPVPEVITYVSGFRQTAISDDSLMAIGLDMYLGSNEELYNQVGVYQYLKKNMTPSRVVPDCILFWLETEIPFNDSVNNLVTNLIYKGKLLYIAELLLPDQPDTLLWGFTSKEMDFCINNEDQMWAYLVSNKLLFNTDRFTIDEFVREAPFTNDFGNNSPGRAALYTGYRIVENYMRKNSEVSINELLHENDYMKILNLSAYNPD